MTSAVRLAVSWLLRAPGRSLIRVSVLAASVALLGGMLLFVGNSLRTVAGSAVREVPLDLQGPVAAYQEARALAREVGGQTGVLQASATATAPLAGAEHSGPSGRTNSGPGALLAVPLDYATHLHTYRLLQGALRPGAIVLDQQMAATLQAPLGDRVSLSPPGGGTPRTYPVSGVALVTSSDKLFQPLNPQLGPAPAQPPANVAIMPLDTFASTYARGLTNIGVASTGANVQPGAQTGVQWQVQTQLDPVALSGGSPSQALEHATQTRNRLERTFPGRIQFVDNLSDSLNTAAGDALYAETLYIMLAVPGALIALGLAYLAARQRRARSPRPPRCCVHRRPAPGSAGAGERGERDPGADRRAAGHRRRVRRGLGPRDRRNARDDRAGAGDRRDLRAAGNRRGRRGAGRRQRVLPTDERRHGSQGDASRGAPAVAAPVPRPRLPRVQQPALVDHGQH
jgi:hypothetical protein